MRHIICIEGDEAVPGQYILPNALSWPNARQRVGYNFNWGQPALGWASDLRREENGSLTAEIEILEEYQSLVKDLLKDDFACYSIYMQPAEFHTWKDVIWITKATIRGISLILQPWWSNKPIK